MDPININNASAEELLNAHAHLWNHMYSYLNSMALRCAIQLGISDAIHKQGKAMTLSELAIALSIPPNKAPCISRIMRLLFHSNFFSKRTSSSGEEAFDLTIHSQLLLKDHPLSVAPFALLALDPIVIEPTFHFGSWSQNEEEYKLESPFQMTHKRSVWEYAKLNLSLTSYSMKPWQVMLNLL
ncbi:Trans-resveratrol di-O-methyltransferase [Bienertia sinuspersici]